MCSTPTRTPRIADARHRVAERLKQVRRQIEAPRLVKLLAAKGVLELGAGAWAPQVENGEANASWRLNIAVPPGKYRFEARLKTRGVDPLAVDVGEGAGLRVSGGSRKGQPFLKGDTPWQPVSFDIESSGRDFVLVAELRAKAGELWIDRKSLRIVRMP